MEVERRILFQLRHLFSLLRDRGDQQFHYKDVITSDPEINQNELFATVSRKVGVVLQHNYSILILRKLILTKFQLLCTSLELTQDVQFSYGEFKGILLRVEDFNRNCYAHSPDGSLAIELAHLTDLYLDSHTKWLSSTLYKKPSLDELLQVTQFEASFSRTLLSLIATFTSLLSTDARNHKKKRRKQYVSEDVLSTQSSGVVGWSDYLIPGAQSDILRITCKDVFNKLWSKVAESLAVKIEPLLQEDWVMKELVPWLVTASELTGYYGEVIPPHCLVNVFYRFELLSCCCELSQARTCNMSTTALYHGVG